MADLIPKPRDQVDSIYYKMVADLIGDIHN